MTREKIVITGLGAVAPNGNSVDEFWTSLTAGRSGIGPITCFDPSGPVSYTHLTLPTTPYV